MALYESVFIQEAAFANNQILRAVKLTNKLVSRRIGVKLYSSDIPVEFITSNGKFAGLDVLIPGFKRLRYNWRLGKSSEIVSIDFWLKKKKGLVSPDYTIDVEGISAPKLVDIIAKILKGNIQPEFQIIEESIKDKQQEDITPQAGKRVTDAIGAWARTQDISDERLENTRISVLWRDFQFWFNETASEEFSNMSELTFRNYILKFLQEKGLNNKFVRSIKVRNGNKEKIINTDDASEASYQSIEHLKLSLNDKIDFMKQNIISVLRGYTNATVICGKSGIGKTTITNQLAKEEGVKVVNINGAIRNLKVLYGLFYNNNDPKTVIIFDDVEDLFKPNFMPVINAALDDHNPRIISFPMEVGKEVKKFKPEIAFTGKIIILTNLPKVKLPRAMFSRTVPVEVTSSEKEMLDQLRVTLNGIMPEIDLKYKEEVLEFLEKLGKNLANIDYRVFKRALIFRMTFSPSWKKYVYAMVS